MDFRRSKVVTLTASYQSFTIEITNRNDEPDWTVCLIDYDDNTGAVGEFPSEEEAVRRIDEFLALAIPAYNAKHAKYGRMPVIRPGADGTLVMVLEENEAAEAHP